MKKDEHINHHKEFISMIQFIGQKYDVHKVWMDIFELFAIQISNRVDAPHEKYREQRAKEIRLCYGEQDNLCFDKLFYHLTQMLAEQASTGKFADIAGQIYHELNLHSKWKAQFFTPQNVADMMAEICFNGHDIKAHGYFVNYEPACGSGVMVLAMANALIEHGHCFYRDMITVAVDSDLKCAHMCYVQLSLYGLPAVVVHGNSITQENWSYWYTPIYIIGGWYMRDWKKKQ